MLFGPKPLLVLHLQPMYWTPFREQFIIKANLKHKMLATMDSLTFTRNLGESLKNLEFQTVRLHFLYLCI